MLSNHKIALLGGLSWHSTQLYYQKLNGLYQQKKGAHHSLPLMINSLDFQQVLNGFTQKDKLIEALKKEISLFPHTICHPVLIASNTVHALFEDLQQAFPQLFWLHIADALGQFCVQHKIQRLGLLGTRYTMTKPFYKKRLLNNFGLEILIPEANIHHLHRIITEELIQGKVLPQSKLLCHHICTQLEEQGVQAIAMACTELPMILSQNDASVPLLDTIHLHCQEGIRLYLEGQQ